MDTEQLNKYLEGIYMGIETFKDFEKKCNNESSLKALVGETKNIYHNHAAVIGNRIRDLGGDPPKSLGIGGKITETFGEMKNLFVTGEDEIREAAYKAAKTGVEMEEKFLRDNSNLDNETKTLIEGTIKEDKDQLTKFD